MRLPRDPSPVGDSQFLGAEVAVAAEAAPGTDEARPGSDVYTGCPKKCRYHICFAHS